MNKRLLLSRGLPLLALLLAAGLVIHGVSQRREGFQAAQARAQEDSTRKVAVIGFRSDEARTELTFPGRFEAYLRAPIYSRVSGYLLSWKKNIGDPVGKGEVLAEIDSPEVDQQLQLAQSGVAAALSQEHLSRITYERVRQLASEDATSVQELDQRLTEYDARKSNTSVARSNLQRAEVFAQYTRLQAPFAGVLTERNTDVGALISAGSGKPLFVIENSDRLRLFVNVPQMFRTDIKPGMKAQLSVPEYPGVTFEGVVVRSARSISETSGSLLVEIEIQNQDHRLSAGGYAQVRLKLPSNSALPRVPASAVLIRKEGPTLATVVEPGVVKFQPVKLGRDFGREVEVISSLDKATVIINNPSDSMIDGEAVKVVTPQ